MGIGGGARQQGFHRQRKIGRQLAEKHCDGVFILRSRDANVDGRRLRTLQCGPGLYHGYVVVHAGIVKSLCEIECFWSAATISSRIFFRASWPRISK